MEFTTIKTVIATRDSGEIIELKIGGVYEITLKDGIVDTMQLTSVNDKSISAGSYTTPSKNPRYIKLKNIKDIEPVYGNEGLHVLRREKPNENDK